LRGAEGAILGRVCAARVVLLCAYATAAQAGIAIGCVLRVAALPHPACALGGAGRSAEVGPSVAIGALAVGQVGVRNDSVLTLD